MEKPSGSAHKARSGASAAGGSREASSVAPARSWRFALPMLRVRPLASHGVGLSGLRWGRAAIPQRRSTQPTTLLVLYYCFQQVED